MKKGGGTVAAAARIEQGVMMNGNEELVEQQKLVLGSADPEIGTEKWNGEEISPLTFISPFAYKMVIHLDEKIVTQDMMQNLDKKLRVTKGLFMIKYYPRTDRRRVKGRPFSIGQDLIRMRIHVSGPKHWHQLCDKVPELKWIERNSTMSDGMFDLAAKHPGMSFWFSIDWLRYVEKLRANAKAEEEQKTAEKKPFAAYKCSADEYREHYKDKTATIRHLHDVLKEVQEVEQLPTVQKEMLENTGETGITHEHYLPGRGAIGQPRDPVTGQFLHKNKNQDQDQNQEQDLYLEHLRAGSDKD